MDSKIKTEIDWSGGAATR